MKTVGIIGGLGPETTSKFYLEIISLCQDLYKEHRPEILISSVPLAYSVEKEAIANGNGEEKCAPLILNAAKELEMAGADFLVMPCNSLHVYIEQIRKHVDIPVLSIVEETSKFLKINNVSEVGIIATSITLNKELYRKTLTSYGIKQLLPEGAQQPIINKIVHRLVSCKQFKSDHGVLMEIINTFEAKGIKNVILACTDLQLLMPNNANLKIYDTMKIFAEATAKEIIEN